MNWTDGDDGVFLHDEADKSYLLLHENALKAGLLKRGGKDIIENLPTENSKL